MTYAQRHHLPSGLLRVEFPKHLAASSKAMRAELQSRSPAISYRDAGIPAFTVNPLILSIFGLVGFRRAFALQEGGTQGPAYSLGESLFTTPPSASRANPGPSNTPPLSTKGEGRSGGTVARWTWPSRAGLLWHDSMLFVQSRVDGGDMRSQACKSGGLALGVRGPHSQE